MNKDILEQISTNTNKSLPEVKQVFTSISEFLKQNMRLRNRILLNGFGTLRLKKRYELIKQKKNEKL